MNNIEVLGIIYGPAFACNYVISGILFNSHVYCSCILFMYTVQLPYTFPQFLTIHTVSAKRDKSVVPTPVLVLLSDTKRTLLNGPYDVC